MVCMIKVPWRERKLWDPAGYSVFVCMHRWQCCTYCVHVCMYVAQVVVRYRTFLIKAVIRYY